MKSEARLRGVASLKTRASGRESDAAMEFTSHDTRKDLVVARVL